MRDDDSTQSPWTAEALEGEAGVDPRWSQITKDEFARAVADLPDDVRAVYELQAFERQSYDQIAARLIIPRDAVGDRLHRARTLLKAALMRPASSGTEGK